MDSSRSPERTQNRPAHLVIDSEAVRHNLTVIKQFTPNAKVMAVIKADAYGHGMELAADTLSAADEFGVNGLDDVVRLRAHGVDKTLTMLSAMLNTEQLNSLSAMNVRTVFFDHAQMPAFEQINDSAALDLWLKVDTGMGRLGVLPDELESSYAKLNKIKGIRSISLMSHLANADNPESPANETQIKQTMQLAEQFEFKEVSLLNSAGVVNYFSAEFKMVRPGLMLYGISPTPQKSADALNLKAAMTFKSELISVKRLPAGSSVGYGSTYTLDADSRIGLVAVGYGDGYPRHAPSGTPVLVNDMFVPLIGRVSMDMIAIDLGELAAEVGDAVILWGADNPIENLAEMAGTIAYELTCGVTARVERIVI